MCGANWLSDLRSLFYLKLRIFCMSSRKVCNTNLDVKSGRRLRWLHQLLLSSDDNLERDIVSLACAADSLPWTMLSRTRLQFGWITTKPASFVENPTLSVDNHSERRRKTGRLDKKKRELPINPKKRGNRQFGLHLIGWS